MSRLFRGYPYLHKYQLAKLLHVSNQTLRRELNQPYIQQRLKQLIWTNQF